MSARASFAPGRTWSAQRGGLGKTGGPGETQIELDRRQIADRIVKLKRELGRSAPHARHAAPRTFARWPAGGWCSWATPMPASRACSTASPKQACSRRT
ncbi:MAG: hypothetical protein WDM79_16580 [Terricaulis sp.]